MAEASGWEEGRKRQNAPKYKSAPAKKVKCLKIPKTLQREILTLWELRMCLKAADHIIWNWMKSNKNCWQQYIFVHNFTMWRLSIKAEHSWLTIISFNCSNCPSAILQHLLVFESRVFYWKLIVGIPGMRTFCFIYIGNPWEFFSCWHPLVSSTSLRPRCHTRPFQGTFRKMSHTSVSCKSNIERSIDRPKPVVGVSREVAGRAAAQLQGPFKTWPPQKSLVTVAQRKKPGWEGLNWKMDRKWFPQIIKLESILFYATLRVQNHVRAD